MQLRWQWEQFKHFFRNGRFISSDFDQEHRQHWMHLKLQMFKFGNWCPSSCVWHATRKQTNHLFGPFWQFVDICHNTHALRNMPNNVKNRAHVCTSRDKMVDATMGVWNISATSWGGLWGFVVICGALLWFVCFSSSDVSGNSDFWDCHRCEWLIHIHCACSMKVLIARLVPKHHW